VTLGAAALFLAARQFVIDGRADELGASLTPSPQGIHLREGPLLNRATMFSF
jgi:hypothetical protein